jgi:hypothetical protein
VKSVLCDFGFILINLLDKIIKFFLQLLLN